MDGLVVLECFQFPRRDRGRTKETRENREDVRLGTHSIVWRETVSRWRQAEAALIDRSASDRPDLWIPGDVPPRNCLVYRRPTFQPENRRGMDHVKSYFRL